MKWRPAAWAPVVCAAIIFCFAARMGWFLFPAVYQQLRTRPFKIVGGQLMSCDVASPEGARPVLHLQYQYIVDGQRYVGTRWRAPHSSSEFEELCRRLGGRDQLDVFFNPAQPADAVLEKGVGG